MMAAQVGNASDPVEYLLGESGEFALRILILTLLMTPLQIFSGWRLPAHLRRLFGLFTFAYAMAHFLCYVLLDWQLDFAGIWDDVLKRKYITVGFAALLLMLPLAMTSNDFSLRRLGFTRWKKLHRAVYFIAPLAVLHFFWQVRGDDWSEAAVYTGIVAVLLVLRLPPLAEKFKRK